MKKVLIIAVCAVGAYAVMIYLRDVYFPTRTRRRRAHWHENLEDEWRTFSELTIPN